MKKWKDKNESYKSDVIISSEIKYSYFRLSVHRHIQYESDAWLASCHPIFSAREMKSKNLNEAKIQAKSILQAILEDWTNDVNDV